MTKDLKKEYKKNLHKKRKYELLNYDKKQHLELLDKQGEEFQSKLQTYSIILIDQLNCEIRDQYLELLKNYTEEKIDSLDFRNRFSERYETIEKVEDLLKSNRVLLSPDRNSLNFGDRLADIENCCKAYGDHPEPFRDKFEIGEVEFRILMEKIYKDLVHIVERPIT